MKKKVIAKLMIAMALSCGAAHGQELNNPNKLPLCPKIDVSATYDIGVGGRTGKWTNCWGRYKVELSATNKGDVLEGDWRTGALHGQGTYYFLAANQFKGDKYVGEYKEGNKHGQGTYTWANGDKYVGEWKDNIQNGLGTYYHLAEDQWKGWTYFGYFLNGLRHAQSIYTRPDGTRIEGIYENNNFIREAKVNLPNLNNNIIANADRTDIDRERKQLAEERRRLEEEKRQQEQQAATERESQRQQLAEERRRLEEEKRQREQQRRNERVNLQVTHTQPAPGGSLTINIQTNADTASLKINGEEQGGRANGDYTVKKVARAGQETKFTIVATDINGNKDTKTITVSRAVVESKASFSALNPANIKKQVDRDAVAVVIGIADYRSLPKADFSNDDARAFYDYAIRALGIKPENIKLLVDGDAEEAEILKTFRTWLPSRVKSTTVLWAWIANARR